MKFLLVNPQAMGRYWKPATPHVGFGYLAETLLTNKHDVEIADMRLNINFTQLVEKIQKFKPDYIGLTAASLEYQKVYNLIDKIKEGFDIPIIMGGPHASIVKEQVLQYSKTDWVVYGEGEKTILDVAQGFRPEKIKGLIWRNKRGEIVINPPRELIRDLDELPFPKYKKFSLDKYLEHKIPLIGERGCPYGCTYCASRLILGRGFRKRSPENILEEIKYWYKRGYRDFGFNDDEFTGDAEWAEKICDLIIKNNLKITFELRTGVRVNKVNERLIKKMKESGFFFFAFGIESADQKVLDLMKKGTNSAQARRAVQLVNKYGLESSGFFMIGLPGDTPVKFRKTLEFAKSLNLNEVRFYNTVPYPGTELYDWVLKNGRFLYSPEVYLNKYDRLQRNPVFETDDFSAEERQKAFDLGERFFAERLIVKTLGKKLGAPMIFLSKNNFFCRIIIKIGFRLTPYVRRIQRLRRVLFHHTQLELFFSSMIGRRTAG